MKVVGLTGGIGSGKTTVAGMFRELGIPVFIADESGKRLMKTSDEIRESIIEIFGTKAYSGNEPNRKYIASKVFNDSHLLQKLNSIIHPAVAKDFQKWLESQNTAYVIYEAAILFETGKYKDCDFSVLVTAPEEIRIERLQERDNSTKKEIRDRMDNQWDDEKKRKLSDFIIKNVDLQHTRQQVEDIHAQILKAGKNS